MEKKEAIASSPTTNLTLHFEKDFQAVGEEGTPEADKINEGVKLELRRALRKFDKHVQYILDKYKYKSR